MHYERQRLHGDISERPKGNYKHGMVHSPEFKVWLKMIERCLDPNDKRYHRYGGRGIKICDRWLESFTNFLADMGERPAPNYSIERKNNDKGYSPDNCIWATKLIQANNTSTNVFFEFKGKKQTLAQWAREYDANYKKFHARLKLGWDFEKALNTSIDGRRRIVS